MMETLQYIIGSAAWSLLGFAAGVYVVTVQREVHAIKATVVDDGAPSPSVESWQQAGEAYEKARRRFGVLILVLALVSLVQIGVSQLADQQQIDCQNTVNRALREDALIARARSAEDWVTIREFLTAVDEAGDDLAAVRRAARVANDALGNPPKGDPVAYIADEC